MSAPQPDRLQAAAFLRFLDPAATEWEFRTFDDDDRKAPRPVRVLYGSLNKHWPALLDLSNRGAGIFVTVNQTDGRGRDADSIVRVRALFADLDGAPLANVWNVPLDPGWVSRTSPGRFHVYWKVEGIARHEFRDLQKRIIVLHSDRGLGLDEELQSKGTTAG